MYFKQEICFPCVLPLLQCFHSILKENSWQRTYDLKVFSPLWCSNSKWLFPTRSVCSSGYFLHCGAACWILVFSTRNVWSCTPPWSSSLNISCIDSRCCCAPHSQHKTNIAQRQAQYDICSNCWPFSFASLPFPNCKNGLSDTHVCILRKFSMHK